MSNETEGLSPRVTHQPRLGWNELRVVLDKLPVAAYICDPQGLITYFNGQAAKLWGREPKLNDPADRYCGSFKLLLPDQTPISHSQSWVAKALQTGQDFNGEEIVI